MCSRGLPADLARGVALPDVVPLRLWRQVPSGPAPGRGDPAHPGRHLLHVRRHVPLGLPASDTLSTGGTFMLNVRPVRSHTRLPRGVALPRVDQTGAGKVFGALRAHAVIDVLLEPLGENSVRFAFQMSDHVPAFMPSWVINYIVQNAMADIFDKMHEVAVRMHSRDAKSPHVKHVNKASYKPVREWYARKMKSAESLWR